MDNTSYHLSAHLRNHFIEQLDSHVFDLVIVGGGITGAGVARDAASRGMKVALIDAQDFAQGTSSRSSKLIHGGIRYLENLEFHLVFEALSERRLLFEIAPHLVHPLRFVLPLYKNSRVGMFKMGLGMWLYDALSLFEAPEMHERLDSHESLQRVPMLRSSELVGSFVYSDAYMDDDRLVHETLRSAARLGAVCANHTKATDAIFKDGKMTAIKCKDLLGSRECTIRGRHFLSTTGPWTDRVGSQFLKDWKKVLRPSKGVHLTFDRSRLNLESAVVMAADNDKRIVFAIPRHEMVVIGTTDTDFPYDPAEVNCQPKDVDYLLAVASHYFPGANLRREDIVSSYAGVRPLVDDGSASESKTSREHLIYSDARNITFIAGGKYTTYRRMAEQAVQHILKLFPIEDQIRFGRNDTQVPLNPNATADKVEAASRWVNNWSEQTGIAEPQMRILAFRHAGETEGLLGPDYFRREETSEQTMLRLEALFAIRETMCMHLVDFYSRRMPLFLARKDHGLPHAPYISQIFAHEFGWSENRRADEMQALAKHVERELAWKMNQQIGH